MHRTALYMAIFLMSACGASLGKFSTALSAPPVSRVSPTADHRLIPLKTTPLPAQATWILRSDMKLNGQVEAPIQTDRLALKVRNDTLSGRYVGQQAQGKGNQSRFSGEIIRAPASGAVMTLRQEDRWYVACYAGQLTGQNRFTGTWFDSDGRAGDFDLSIEPR